MDKGTSNRTVLKTVLKAFIPHSRENTMLAFKPGQFFNHLDYIEKVSGANRATISSTISRAKRAGLLKTDDRGNLQTTWRGKLKVPSLPNRKIRNHMVIIFDIPEHSRNKRDLFRRYLQSTGAEQVQKSVWKTQYDIYNDVLSAIKDLEIVDYVSLFMADEISKTTG